MGTIGKVVCNNFNRLMDASGKSKREVARSVNVSEATLQRWKSGVSSPELANIEKLAKVFRVDPMEFYQAEPSPPAMSTFKTRELIKEIEKRTANIPEEICDKAEGLGVESEVWAEVIVLLNAALARQERKRKGQAQA